MERDNLSLPLIRKSVPDHERRRKRRRGGGGGRERVGGGKEGRGRGTTPFPPSDKEECS